MWFSYLIQFLTVILILVNCNRVYRDPDVIRRIPKHVRDSIDAVVAERVRRAVSTHFGDEDDNYFLKSIKAMTTDHVLMRNRRQVDNSTNSTAEGIYSPWSDFSKCSVKCGGGIQVRSRTCVHGNCTSLGSYTETRECGTLPCVSGTYVLTGVAALENIEIFGAKSMKFYEIRGFKFFAYITNNALNIRMWSPVNNGYMAHQTIQVTEGIDFDIMVTYPRTYMVVIEKSVSVFAGRFSRMLFYNPRTAYFDTTQPITFDVWNPSSVKTFNIIGKPFMALVNYENKVSTDYGFEQEATVCDGASKIVSCPPGTFMSVKQAFYGRLSMYECPVGASFFPTNYYYNWCVVPGVKERVSLMCDNKESCFLEAKPAALTNDDSCVQVSKYLKIAYTCARISYMGEPVFYRWDGIGLSLVSGEKLVTYGAKDIEAFSIHNQNYIAVANYINDQKSHHLDSEVYVYNLQNRRFQSLQRLRTDGAVDWEFFKIGEGLTQEYFLAVANHVKKIPNGVTTYEVESVIYKWNWNVFVPFQCFKTYGAMKWSSITGINGEFVLSIVNQYGNTTFFGYDGWRFYETKIQPKGPAFENANSIATYLKHDQPMFIIQNENVNVTQNIYQVEFMRTFPKYELLDTTLLVVEKLNRTLYEEVIPKVTAFNASYKTVKEDLIFLNQDFNITDHKSFDKIEVLNNTLVHTATAQTVNLSPTDFELQRRQDVVSSLLEEHNTTIVAANKVLDRVVTISTEQTINATKTFSNLTVANMLLLGDLNVQSTINGVDLSQLRDDALYIDKNDTITAEFTFSDHVNLRNDLFVTGSINDISTADFLTVDQDEEIAGLKSFTNASFVSSTTENNVRVDGYVNDMILDQLLTVTGNQTIFVPFTFNDTVTVHGNLAVRETVNDIDISSVASNIVMINVENATITAKKYFKQVDFDGNLNMKLLREINGVDVSELNKNGIHIGADDVINVSLVFTSNVTFLGAVTILGSVNKINISDVVFLDSPATITGAKQFTKDLLLTSALQVDGTVNSVDISENVLNNFSNQTITAEKTFVAVTDIKGDMRITGTIDDIDISAAYADSILMNVTQNITGYKVIRNLTVSKLNMQCDHDCALLTTLTNLQDKTARNVGSPVVTSGTKTFTNGLMVNATMIVNGTVNGIDLPGDLLLQDANQTLHGHNVFEENVSIFGNINVTEINNVTVSNLYEKAWRKTENNIFNGDKTFANDIHFQGNLDVNKTIDGVRLHEQVVLSANDQIITVKKTFHNETFVYNLYVHNMTTYGFIDGVNLTYMNEQLIRLSGDTIVKGTKVFTNDVTFAGDFSIPGLIDGVNITELAENAMRLEGDQIITSFKTFTSSVSVEDDLSVVKLVDGVNLTELFTFAVLKDGGEYMLTENITFDNVTVTNNIEVVNLLDGRNLTQLLNDTLMRHGDQVVTGNHSITNLYVTGNTVADTVNDMYFAEQVVPIDSDSVVTGTKTFTEDILVNHLDVARINGISLQNLSNRVLKVNSDATITGYFTFYSKIVVENNLTVAGLINGVNITDLVGTTLTKNGSQTVSSKTLFTDVIFANDMTNNNLFNGINLTEFSSHVVYRCHGENRNITGDYVFHAMEAGGTVHTEDVSVTGLLNGIDIQQLEREVVTLYGNHTIKGRKRVLGFLLAQHINASTVNGYNIPIDFVLLTKNESVVGEKTFMDDINVLNDIQIAATRTVNDVDLSAFENNVVMLNSSETVLTPVEFVGTMTVFTNLLLSSINNVEISAEKLLLRHGNQTVTANKTFLRVHTEKDIVSNNDIQGFDLKKMKNETVLSGRQNLISGRKTVVGNVTVEGNIATNFVDTVNVTKLFFGFNRISNLLEKELDHFNETITLHKRIITQLSNAIDNIHQNIDYFTQDQHIFLPYQSVTMDVLVDDNLTWLVVGAFSDVDGVSCTNSSVFKRIDGDNFTLHAKILGNAITDTNFIKSDGLYLASTSAKKNGGCFPNLSANKEWSATYKLNISTEKFDQFAIVETGKAEFVDILVLDDGMKMLYTNTYNDSELTTCVTQYLSTLVGNSHVTNALISACDVIKSILISSTDDVTTIAILSKKRTVEIFDVYKNSSSHRKQVITTYYASDITQFSTTFGKFLVIANTYDTSSEALAVSYSVPVTVYSMNTDGLFQQYQDVHIPSAVQVQHFHLGIYSYLCIATYNQKIFIMKHKGISKWRTELTVPIQGLGSIKGFKLWKSADDVYLGVMSDNVWADKYPAQLRIMKASLTTAVEGSVVKEKVQ